MRMHSTRHTVLSLDVHLGKRILLVHGRLAQVTHGSSLNHVADDKAGNGLVLTDTTVAVQTADRLDMSAAVLRASVISSLASLYTHISDLKRENTAKGWMDIHHAGCKVELLIPF